MTGSAFAMLSVPTFLSAILLIYLFAVELRWLPATGYVPFAEDPAANLRFMVLPALTLALAEWPGIMRVLRSDMIATLQEDYIALAKAKGLKAVAHPVRACAEAVVADAGHDHRHQYRPIDRRRGHRRDDLCACRASAGCWSARSTPATSSSCRAWCCWSPPAS